MEKNDLPESWELVSLSTIAKINLNKPSRDEIPDNTLASFVPMKSVEAITGKINLNETRKCGDVRKGYTFFQNNDILFAKITPCMENGKIAIANNLENNLGFGSTEFHVIRLKDKINPKFYFYYLIQDDFRNKAQHEMKGTAGQLRVSSGYLKNEFIPLPPLNEQKRVVEKIEELFSQLNFQFKTIRHTNNLLKSYEKSILKDGFNGNLTKTWRKNHNPKKPKILLEKIDSERKTKNLEEFDMLSSVISSTFEKDWEISVLGFVTENHDGKRIPVSKIKREEMKGNYPYYGASGIIDYVDKPLFRGKHLLIGEDGANLLARSTPIAFLADGEFWVNNHAHVLKTLGNIPLKFILYFINSIDLSEWVTGTAQPKLNQRNMNKIPIPMPSIEEQIEIVKILDQNLLLIDNQLDLLKMWDLTLIKLRSSILKQAFEGKLVPQDPNDEPASELLKRIKLEN